MIFYNSENSIRDRRRLCQCYEQYFIPLALAKTSLDDYQSLLKSPPLNILIGSAPAADRNLVPFVTSVQNASNKKIWTQLAFS